jgi:MFS family permease
MLIGMPPLNDASYRGVCTVRGCPVNLAGDAAAYNSRMKKGRTSQLRETFRVSITEGAFSQVFNSLAGPGSVFVTRLAVMLNASPLGFSILSAIGQLSQVIQPLGVAVTRRRSRRRPVVILMAAAGRAMTPLLGLTPLLLPAAAALPVSLLLFALITAVLSVSTNMWMGWIADMVPLRVRGRFFARRNQVLMVAGLLASFVFGAFVDLYSEERGWIAGRIARILGVSPDPSGLFAVFAAAGILGLVGLLILRRQPENPKQLESERYRTILKAPLADANFRKLCVFGAWWMLAVGIGSPFWQPFMMQRLRMSIVGILVYGTLSTAGALLAVRPWGRFIDRYGNKPAMRIAMVLGAINPVMWLFVTPQSLWIIYSEAVLSGVMWSCVGIVMANLVLAIAPAGRKQVYSGVFNAVSGLAVMVTMLASGMLMPRGMTLFGRPLYPEQVLFLATAAARLTAEIPISWVHEPSSVAVGEILEKLQQYSKVRIATLFTLLFRRGRSG